MPTHAPNEWGDVALTTSREQFVAVYRHPFLYSTQRLVKPRAPQRTDKFDISELIDTKAIRKAEVERTDGDPTVYPVNKVQESFPSMITLGRTHNNDIVIDDVQVSKFHAFFRMEGSRIELHDAGSSNGTQVNGVKLEPKGPGREVRLGDLIVFGPLEFVLLASADCWERLVDVLEPVED